MEILKVFPSFPISVLNDDLINICSYRRKLCTIILKFCALKDRFSTAVQKHGVDDSSVVSGEDEKIKEEKEGEPSETVPWETLFSGISLFSLRDTKKVDLR